MPDRTRKAHPELINIARMKDAAVAAGRSAEALFGYLSRLDALRAASADLGPEALAERAADAELHMRIVLNAGLDALNELQDLGLVEHAVGTAAKHPADFNGMNLTEAMGQIASVFQEKIPEQRWDWLTAAAKLVEDVGVRVEAEGKGFRGIVTHGGQSIVLPLALGAAVSRVGNAAFFSAGPTRVCVPTSAISTSQDKTAAEKTPTAVAAYDGVVGGMAFAREWVNRHARNAAELGPPARTGGGPVVVVIVIVLVAVAALAEITAGILYLDCEFGGSDSACKWSGRLNLIGLLLGGAAGALAGGSSTTPQQQPSLSYGTNPQ